MKDDPEELAEYVAAARRSEDTIGVLLDAGTDGAGRALSDETPLDLVEALRGTDACRRPRDALIP